MEKLDTIQKFIEVKQMARSVYESDLFSNENKIDILKTIISELRKVQCYVNRKPACPFCREGVQEYNDKYTEKSTEIICEYCYDNCKSSINDKDITRNSLGKECLISEIEDYIIELYCSLKPERNLSGGKIKRRKSYRRRYL